jgi:hypothetical protein
MEKLSWPKTKTGVIDWENVFENPSDGIIPMISQASSKQALRKSSIAVIKQVYTRKDDPQITKRFISEFNKLISDESNNDNFPLIISNVSTVLRDLKKQCIRKAEEYDQYKDYIKDSDKRDAIKYASEAKENTKAKPEVEEKPQGTVVPKTEAIQETIEKPEEKAKRQKNAKTKNEIWPKTKSGCIDWETAFENSENGLLSFIMKAKSPKALRESSLAIVSQLYTRKDDPHQVEILESELHRLIPENSTIDDMPRLSDLVIYLLRDVKDQCIKKAEEYDEYKDLLPDENKRDAAKRALKTKQHARPTGSWLITGGSIACVIAALVLGTILFLPGAQDEDKRDILIEQMETISATSSNFIHIYNGRILVDVKNGKVSVTAMNIPVDVCAGVAWHFMNRGKVVINNVIPFRSSPNILEKYCNLVPSGASITWIPKSLY